MKFTLSLLAIFMVMSCGILELFFPIEYPQRYIEREVKPEELVGTWKITPDSEIRANEYFQQKNIELWDLDTPWKTISLYEDGSCDVDLELSWAIENSVLREPDAPATCTWRIDTVLGYDEVGQSKDVPGVFVRFEHYNGEEAIYKYNVDYSESFIVEENRDLILWNYIGNVVRMSYQDFKKEGE